ncbi:carboxymuconolactone decarboxylase family protein [Actinospica durhamensis]|uniref:Carboxymuconolactone decarboxylase family protein n=1 Tax=Actinospica durhamensis TaxID=1508375 RepID=A0A941IKL5_9ACTN|nr:carboxymuconolactone decarboxylase family protein [Actinospica durhamensis]MBR7831975.1 carboxymuconolactone decarboxylase family protein [Actinospica durhamensis]
MASALARSAMRPLALAQIRYVEPARPGSAGASVDEVYRQVERDFGVLAPPVAMHSPAPETMAASWLMLRETLLAPGLIPRAVREAVASAVSLENTCPYCVTVHSATLHGLSGGKDARHVAAGEVDRVRDPAVRAAAAWIADEARGPFPFPVEQAPEYVGVAVTFHYLNRMVNTFLEDAPMPPRAPRQGLGMVKRVLSGMIRAAGRHIGAPGDSLDLLPKAATPLDAAWTQSNPIIAQAFARADAAIERAGERSVPSAVRTMLRMEVEAWDGRPKGVSRAWVEDCARTLPAEQRPAGRLALLTALASYQIDASLIGDFRMVNPDDAPLIELTAWSAWTAARTQGRRLYQGT